MALFLDEEASINVSLEATYRATWNALPQEVRQAVEQPSTKSV
jgi:hypothetical protein